MTPSQYLAALLASGKMDEVCGGVEWEGDEGDPMRLRYDTERGTGWITETMEKGPDYPEGHWFLGDDELDDYTIAAIASHQVGVWLDEHDMCVKLEDGYLVVWHDGREEYLGRDDEWTDNWSLAQHFPDRPTAQIAALTAKETG